MIYSPFNKELNELDESELQTLIDKSICESWYIEYKANIPKKSGKIDGFKISKSISAFANTNGGWLFYGIEADNKNIATKLCGIDTNEYNNLADQFSQIISSNITPEPIYHFKIVPLNTSEVVFVIKVDEGPTPPYITSHGIIYQRENNESNPIRDRYIIEKLTEKTNEYYEEIERFCNIDYAETKGQSDSNQSYLELYLFPLPFNHYTFEKFNSSDFFKKVALRFYQSVKCTFEDTQQSIPLNLNFNSIYSSQNSLIIRPLNKENFIYKTTTVELFRNGCLKLLLPLREFSMENVPSFYQDSDIITYLSLKYGRFFTNEEELEYTTSTFNLLRKEIPKIQGTNFVNHIKMIDGVEFIYIILIIISKYKAVLEDNGFNFDNELGFRARITDMWRKFVLFDDEDYLEKIKLYNIPIAPKNEIEIPSFIKGNYYRLDMNENALFLIIAKEILDAIGLPDSSSIKFVDIINNGIRRYSNKQDD